MYFIIVFIICIPVLEIVSVDMRAKGLCTYVDDADNSVDLFEAEFEAFKRHYYMTKFGYSEVTR